MTASLMMSERRGTGRSLRVLFEFVYDDDTCLIRE